jgi:hypothetical protein
MSHRSHRRNAGLLRRAGIGAMLAALALVPAAANGPAGGDSTPAPRLPMPQPPKLVRADDAGAATLARIQALVADASCDSDAQCRAIGIGSRPCGGPEGYSAWSSRVLNEPERQQLRDLVARHASERRRAHEKAGLMSTCELLPVPSTRCERSPERLSGRCVLDRAEAGLR